MGRGSRRTQGQSADAAEARVVGFGRISAGAADVNAGSLVASSPHRARLGIRLTAFVVVVVVFSALDVVIIRSAERVIIRDAALQLEAHAFFAAGQIRGEDLAALRSSEEVDGEALGRVHAALCRVQSAHPGIAWVYTLRTTDSGTGWELVVDVESLAEDGNGVRSAKDNQGAIGQPYEPGEQADLLSESVGGSVVRLTPVNDLLRGEIISGYAPVVDSAGQVQGVVGVDMFYDDVSYKRDVVWVVTVVLSIALGLLLLYVLYLFQRRTVAFGQTLSLQRQLVDVTEFYAKFVPEQVRAQLERNPDVRKLERQERDVSVMFVDLAGYTTMSERLAGESIGVLLERYFSRYIEEIHRCRGQVNETAGDGLMVLFEENPIVGHALDAIEAAVSIERVTTELNNLLEPGEQPVVVNIGVNSGSAFVGLNKFIGITGERYTYTATGPTTNIAARVAGLAKAGDILLCEETARRVGDHVDLERVGRRSLKNVSAPMMIYRPRGAGRAGHIDPAVAQGQR